MLAVIFGGAVEGEEAIVLTGGDVVEAGCLGAEAFVEIGAGEVGESRRWCGVPKWRGFG